MSRASDIAGRVAAQFGRYVPPRWPLLPAWCREIRAIADCGCQRVSRDGVTWDGGTLPCAAHRAAERTPAAGPQTSRTAFGDRGNE